MDDYQILDEAIALPNIKPFAQADCILCFDLNKVALSLYKLPEIFIVIFSPVCACSPSSIW